jgi:hypothetical protein
MINITDTFSKKMTLALTSILFLILTEFLNFDIEFEKLMSMTSIVVSYIIGQSWIDVKSLDKK